MRRDWIISGVLLVVVTIEFVLFFRHPKTSNPARTKAPANSSADAGHSANLRSRFTKEEKNRILLTDIATVPFQELFGLLAGRTPAEIAELARQLDTLPRGTNSGRRLSAFYKVWAVLDPVAAFASALTMERANLRDRALLTVLNNADPKAAGELARRLNQASPERLDRKSKMQMISVAAGSWAQIEPAAAAHFLDQIGAKGTEFSGAFSSIASNWAAQDPVAALAWAQEHGGPYGNQAQQGALNGWWETDPRAAEAYVAAHPLIDRGQMFASFAGMLFDRDPEHARQWVSQLPNAEGRRTAIGVLAQQWAMQDPRAAAQWVAGLPATDRGSTLGAIARVWARQDATAAGDFLNSLGGAAREEAVSSYSAVLAYEEPATAMTWAATIADPARRQKVQAGVAEEWLKQDPKAARAWIANSALSEKEKANLLPSPSP